MHPADFTRGHNHQLPELKDYYLSQCLLCKCGRHADLKEGYAPLVRGVVKAEPIPLSVLYDDISARLCPRAMWCPGGDPWGDGYARPCSNGLLTEDEGASSVEQCGKETQLTGGVPRAYFKHAQLLELQLVALIDGTGNDLSTLHTPFCTAQPHPAAISLGQNT